MLAGISVAVQTPILSSENTDWFIINFSNFASFIVYTNVIQIWLDLSRPNPGWEKINLHFYFHISLCCLKRFHEGL